MKKDFKKFSEITESLSNQSDMQPITLERCREEIIRLLGEDGHDIDASAEEIERFAERLMKEFNFTFSLLERRIFGWKRNNPK
jgi:hypothetical protein